MLRKEREGVQWLEFELLSDLKRVRHAVFLRKGGVSAPPFNSLNVSTSAGDQSEATAFNRLKISRLMEAPLTRINMVHGKHIVSIDELSEENTPVCDGIATHKENIGLMITHADCQAAFFYDPIKHVCANVHCGWKGNVQNIYGEAVKHLHRIYGSSPNNLLVAISPSLGPHNAQFLNYQTEWPEEFHRYQVAPYFFDLWQMSQDQLMEAGVLKDHIQVAHMCTYSNSEDFFSYRRDKPTGRHASVITLK